MASEMVMRWMRAREESAPETPLSWIWRPGAESRFCSMLIRKPLSLGVPSSWATAAIATSTMTAQRCQDAFQNACPMPM